MACLLAPAGCRRETRLPGSAQRHARAGLINVADPRVVSRLVKGFHSADNAYWRWTARESSIILNPPDGANRNGAVLVLRFAVVDKVLAVVRSINLSVAVDGFVLPVQHYDKPGQLMLRLDVPPKALQSDPVRVDFTVDKALTASPPNSGEYAIIISQVGLEAK